MKPPRGLSAGEAALWARLAKTVTPMAGKVPPPTGEGDHPKGGGGAPSADPNSAGQDKRHVPLHHASHGSPPRSGEDRLGLDASWERKLARATLSPDFTLDLHGHTLDQAHHRLDSGLAQAKAMDARLVLLITGKPRPTDAADRGARRGAIRAKVLDWLAAGPHAGDIAAIRGAHRRHGGDGALYLVLKRKR
jgi:DNA-nicking Smr family endonuclease